MTQLTKKQLLFYYYYFYKARRKACEGVPNKIRAKRGAPLKKIGKISLKEYLCFSYLLPHIQFACNLYHRRTICTIKGCEISKIEHTL